MIKVPQYIRNSMHRVVDLNNKANDEMRKVESWLNKNGFDVEYALRDGSGASLEELELGIDIVDLICERIEEAREEDFVKTDC